MQSIEERLVASDPHRTTPSVARDHRALIDRVVAAPYPRPSNSWRAFQAKIAASIAGAGVLTTLGIAALSLAGSTLPVLSLAAGPPKAAAGARAFGVASTFMPINVNYQFTGAERFSTRAPTGDAFTLVAPSDPGATLVHVAAVLGVDIGTPSSPDRGQTLTSAGPQYQGGLTLTRGYAAWSINVTTKTLATSSPALSSAQLAATALSEARQLTNGTLGAAAVTATSSGADPMVSVVVPVRVGGLETPLNYSFTYAPDGTLIDASGQSFSLEASGHYPLLSAALGVGQITAQFGLDEGVGYFASGGPIGVSGVGSVSGVTSTGVAGPSPAGTSSTPGTTATPGASSPTPPGCGPGSDGASAPSDVGAPCAPTPAPTVVELTSVANQYGLYSLTSGASMLLPIYVYTGTVRRAPAYAASFRVLAIDPAYLDLSIVRRLMY